jgi:hypothetical protein
MAYALDNPVRRVGPQTGGNTLWTYVDGDALATIDGSGYFNLDADKLSVGDVILAVGNAVGGIGVVLSNAAGVVDTSNFAGQATIDSD